MIYAAISAVQFQDLEEWIDEIHSDPKLKVITQDLLQDPNAHPGFSIQNGKLLYQGKLVLPKGSPRIPLLLSEFHNSAMGGHSGFFRTYKRISAFVFWEGMRKDIQQYVSACAVCQQNKYQTLTPAVVEEVNRLTEERDVMLHDLKANLVKAQDQMRKYADKHRRDIHFEEGDWVYLKLQPYRLRSLAKKINEKLSPRFYGIRWFGTGCLSAAVA
ncbi:Retrotransposable element Tf2 [Sesbania bispinosa]|nr:Retrotransposable element Tf2 [Sesbania bispinosa]